MSKKIIHLYEIADYTLCWIWATESLNDDGEMIDCFSENDDVEQSYKELYVRKKYNTNCKECQRAVESVLEQIKRKRK